jgi:FtsP/CotA-like multicopper oxidase with cupredoxin domain
MTGLGLRLTIAVALATGLAALAKSAPRDLPTRDGLPEVRPNDNREPAGELIGNVLMLRLEVRMGRWCPERENGPFVIAPVLAEEGKAPEVPGPLIRVHTGTTIVATVRNALADSTVTLHGLATRPSSPSDSIVLRPGESRVVRFGVGAAGTYFYRAVVGTIDHDKDEQEQLAGAFIVDPPGARQDDRIFVINIWGNQVDSTHYRNALAINGRSWPYTERLTATEGDSVRWRFINASDRVHPMHLHGFYYQIQSKGTVSRDTAYAPADRRLVVTEDLRPYQTMSLVWQPMREGNWLFHCHLAFHAVPETRLEPMDHHADNMATDPRRHMGGLVLGVTVQPGAGWRDGAPPDRRALRLLVQEGRPHGHAARGLSFILQDGATPPAPDSVRTPGTVIVLTHGQPTDITVVNRLPEPTSVHWHGIELESWSDGVAGWSGTGNKVAPAIASQDSFTAHLITRRAGTFIYHTHLNDLEQLTAGLYGAIVVLEPGRQFDPASDHVYVAGWDGPADPPRIVVNGDTTAPAQVLEAGRSHRFRFVNIGPAGGVTYRLLRDSTLVTWRPVAVDGADLPASQTGERPARRFVQIGQTFDAEYTPHSAGDYTLTASMPGGAVVFTQQLMFR